MNQDVKGQYKTPANLNARADLHARFSTNPTGWLPWVFGHIRKRLPDSARILEIGCGPGSLWVENRGEVPAGWSLTLTDLSEGMVARSQEVTAQAGLDAACVQADIRGLPFETDTFDAVIANHMLYHVPDIDGGLQEIRRVLKPGGTFFAATNGMDHMKELFDLMNAFTPGAWTNQERPVARFCLQNGGDMIGRYFEPVSRIDYPDSLLVDEAQPLAEYVCSMAGMGVGFESIIRKREDFLLFLEGWIREKGSIRISKQAGLFIAR